LLDSFCKEHPAGHQTKLAARYVLVVSNGERIGLMFEKAMTAPANLWLRADHASRLGDPDCISKYYPASALYIDKDENGRLIYGRHTGLKSMRDLANADLVRLTITNVSQMQRLLHLLGTSL
jgi:hypothetical protein